MSEPIRVLVVDDSAFVRKVLREVLSAQRDIQVVGIARDGLEALEKLVELRPDVVTLDLVMPGLDGVGVLRALPAGTSARFVVVSLADEDSDLGVAALQSGALDVVKKPTALATDRLYELGGELVAKVRAAAGARPGSPTAAFSPVRARTSAAPAPAAASPLAPAPAGVVRGSAGRRVVVVGTSTGGPPALTRLLSALPADLPAPLAMVLHIPPGYTDALARRLDKVSPLTVVEAIDGLDLRAGMAVLARAGWHLRLEPAGDATVCRLDVQPVALPHRPAVDVLFASAAARFGPATLAVVLTGMGDDGLAGARAVRAAGGAVLTESASSCVVHGMPGSVADAGLSNAEAPIDGMAALIEAWL